MHTASIRKNKLTMVTRKPIIADCFDVAGMRVQHKTDKKDGYYV